jgi:hypothetical protein
MKCPHSHTSCVRIRTSLRAFEPTRDISSVTSAANIALASFFPRFQEERPASLHQKSSVGDNKQGTRQPTSASLAFAITHAVSRTGCEDSVVPAVGLQRSRLQTAGPPGPGNFPIAANGFDIRNEENAMNTTRFTQSGLALVAGLALAVSPLFVLAQGPAGRKATGEIYWRYPATSHRIHSARNYAQEFHSFVTKFPQPEPSVVKDVKTELGRYLDEAQQHVAAMKKDYAEDKETSAAIESIEKGLAAAIEHNKAMIACCEDQKFDKIKTMSCCTNLVKQLDKVHAEHVALMKKLPAAPAAQK